MDREYISQHNVIERYLSGRLTDEELVAFEERCLWCQETLDDLDVAERLRDGLRDATTAQTTASVRGPVARLFLSPQWAVAASVMLVMSLGTTGWLVTHEPAPALPKTLEQRLADRMLQLEQQLADPVLQYAGQAGFATTQVYSIEATRGGDGPSAIIRYSPTDGPVVLIVYPELGRHDAYRATLHRKDEDAPVWQLAYIPPGMTDSLALSLPAGLLEPGEYRLSVLGLNSPVDGDTVGEVAFRVALRD